MGKYFGFTVLDSLFSKDIHADFPGGMHDLALAEYNSCVGDPAMFIRKESEIALPGGCQVIYGSPLAHLLRGVTRQLVSTNFEDHLGEA